MVKTGNEKQRVDAAYKLSKFKGDDVVTALLGVLKDKNLVICTNAIFALGVIKSQRAVNPLINISNDVNSGRTMRAAAIHALGQIKDSRAIEPLAKIVDKDDDLIVASAAIVALKSIGDP